MLIGKLYQLRWEITILIAIIYVLILIMNLVYLAWRYTRQMSIDKLLRLGCMIMVMPVILLIKRISIFKS